MSRAELHLHLEGSIEPATLQELDPSLTAEEIESRYCFHDFAGFLECFKWTARRLRAPEDYGLVTRRLRERLAREDIGYAEVTLSAGVVLWKGQDLSEVYRAVREASRSDSVEIRWNLDAIRQFGPEPAAAVAAFAATQVGNGVVSIGIGGDEERGPAEWFADVYLEARAAGLRLTAHAGETAGPESVWAALEIGAERVGHGIRAIDDPVLVRHLANHRIPLEVSISSNVLTGAVRSLEEHPVRRLFEAGVPITLNTDDPAIFRTSLAREFDLARDQLRFSQSELAGMAGNAWTYRFR